MNKTEDNIITVHGRGLGYSELEDGYSRSLQELNVSGIVNHHQVGESLLLEAPLSPGSRVYKGVRPIYPHTALDFRKNMSILIVSVCMLDFLCR